MAMYTPGVFLVPMPGPLHLEDEMIKRIALTTAALLALAGCASPKYVVSDVTRYHTLGTPSGESFAGKTFAIVAVSPEQEQSIAFRQFGDQINNRLTNLGMHQFQGSAS